MKRILLLIIVAIMVFTSCSKEEAFAGRKVTVDESDFVVNMPTITSDFVKVQKEFAKYFKDVELNDKGNCIIITTSTPISDNALFKSIKCIFHLSEGKYESVNIAVSYSMESFSEQGTKDIQQILKEQTMISL